MLTFKQHTFQKGSPLDCSVEFEIWIFIPRFSITACGLPRPGSVHCGKTLRISDKLARLLHSPVVLPARTFGPSHDWSGHHGVLARASFGLDNSFNLLPWPGLDYILVLALAWTISWPWPRRGRWPRPTALLAIPGCYQSTAVS